MCTSLSISDAAGAIYIGRTLEYAGYDPWQLSYFPKGLKFTSAISATENGISYENSLAFIAITMDTLTPGVADYLRLKPMHAMNEAGLHFGFNAFRITEGPQIEADKVSSALALMDVGSWALGQFKTVAEVKAALEKQLIYAPPLAVAKSQTSPFHGIFYDTTGASIVIEMYQGRKCVYDNPVGVMTNAPEFPWHMTNLNNYTNLSNVDCNAKTFGTLQATQPDSGIAASVIPGSNTSVGRFIKALYYSQFAKKAKNPDGAVYMISHVMNNFDRPVDVTMDPPDPSDPSTEGDGQSEFSVWIALSDLNRRKFFVRTYLELNYHQFDLNDFANVTTFQNIPFMARFIGLGPNESRSLAK